MDQRAAMRARFPHWEGLFEYEASGRIAHADAGFVWLGRGPRELMDLVAALSEGEGEETNIARFCDHPGFVRSVLRARRLWDRGLRGGPSLYGLHGLS